MSNECTFMLSMVGERPGQCASLHSSIKYHFDININVSSFALI
ncbi:hypothetical protein D3OALGA1CA_2331 [Olavius algarvensis associated proteobacterium Delta 3]|nr:hypothetical protein D3OALGB2SA_232 [Olavius algarvensis associated proteobacterium Delta 3]CAB5117040.1 hypothetical protein D3OALGA1CA_2331 [Olavius algarvensis associated proteobacterium Delta 3]